MKRIVAAVWACVLVLAIPASSQTTHPGFFFSVNIDLKQDGAGTLRLTYPLNPLANNGTEEQRFASAVTEVKSIEIKDRVVEAIIEFSDVTRLSEARELSSISAMREKLAGGDERIRARLRSPTPLKLPGQGILTITVNMPGQILGANTTDVRGTTAVWRPAASEYFTDHGIDLEATYRPSGKASESKS